MDLFFFSNSSPRFLVTNSTSPHLRVRTFCSLPDCLCLRRVSPSLYSVSKINYSAYRITGRGPVYARTPNFMKQCPQCNRTYDDSWGICLYDESKLTIFKEQTLSRIENKEHTSNHVPLIVRSTSSTRSSTRIESVTKKPSRKIKVKEDGLRRGLMKNKAKIADGAKRNNSLESATGAGLPSDFKLSEEFKRGFDAIEDTRKNLYITGEAGTGKTTLLQYFRKQSKRNYVILAPTGIAAINSHGQTIHSFFKFPPKLIQKSDIKRAYNAKQIFSKLDLVIIDEASMMRADILDGIDYSLRLNKGNMDVPFGGIQIVLFGDLYQLPPIVTKELALFYERLYDSPYFFSAHVFGSVEFDVCSLFSIRDEVCSLNIVNLLSS